MARSALRILALLGFACAAVILFSTAANADNGTTGSAPATASKPGLLPGLLSTTKALLHPASATVSAPTAANGTPSSPVSAIAPTATGAAAHHASSSDVPAAHGVLPVLASVGSAPSAPAGSAGPVAPVAPAALPLHDTLTPVVATAAHGLTGTLTATADVLSRTTSSIPVLGLGTTLLRDAGTATSGVVVSSVDSLTTHLDTQLALVVATTSGLVAPLTGGNRFAAGPPSATGVGGPSAPTTVAGVPGTAAIPVLGDIRVFVPAIAPAPNGSGAGVLPAPPKALGAAALQSAPAVLAYAAPAFGAVGTATGTLPGPAAGAAAGGHEQTEVPRGFDFRTVMAIGRPAAPVVRPLPGTPLVDPGFSPD